MTTDCATDRTVEDATAVLAAALGVVNSDLLNVVRSCRVHSWSRSTPFPFLLSFSLSIVCALGRREDGSRMFSRELFVMTDCHSDRRW